MKSMSTYKGYMVLSLNVKHTDETGTLSITTDGDGYVTGTMTTKPANGFVTNRWNNVVWVVELDGNAASNSGATHYVNGKETWKHTANSTLFNTGKNAIRLKSSRSVLLDDIKVMFTTEKPNVSDVIAMPVLNGIDGKAVVNGLALDVTGTVKVSELEAVNSNMTVFESAAFKNGSADRSGSA